MKTKLSLLLIVLTAITYQSFATVQVIVHGGGARHLFNYVQSSSRTVICTGAGSISCPVAWSNTLWSGVYYPTADIVDYVYKQAESGQVEGEIKFKNEVPVRWKLLPDKSLQIDIEETGVKGLEKYGIY
jgi:hypothetical protein